MSTADAVLASEVEVLIAGAGPTGLTLAGLLGQRGIRTLVVDPHHEAYPLPRAVHLDDEVLQILHQLGVGELFAKISEPASGLRLVDSDHRTLAQFERRESGALPQANMFDQPDLEDLLRRNLSRFASVTIAGGQELVGVMQSSSLATVRVRDVDTGSLQLVHAKFVIGCDGANSVVRNLIGSKNIDLGFEQRWLVVDMQCGVPVDAWNGVQQVCDSNRAATYMHVTGDHHRWEFQLLDGESAGDYRDLHDLRGLIDPWVAHVDDRDLRIVRCLEYTFRARVAQQWRRGRLLIAGDAAHLTPPFIGQGLGSGLRDAMNLAWKLEIALRSPDFDALLDSYEAERAPHAKALVRRAVMIGTVMTGGGRMANAARRVIVPLLDRIPRLGDVILSSATPPLVAGPLVSGRVPRKIRGALLPLVCLVPAAGEVLIDPTVGSGFTLLVSSESDRQLVQGTRAARVVCPAANPSHPGNRALAEWLERAGARFALIRPDGVVLGIGGTFAELARRSEVRSVCLLQPDQQAVDAAISREGWR
ncbi:MAG TPA: bifunctional 3-(3-hydroxy-phenyl)propionate/3-hydroxycinnamic acid hydroxylase [Diaminobutyricibacter sp.]